MFMKHVQLSFLLFFQLYNGLQNFPQKNPNKISRYCWGAFVPLWRLSVGCIVVGFFYWCFRTVFLDHSFLPYVTCECLYWKSNLSLPLKLAFMCLLSYTDTSSYQKQKSKLDISKKYSSCESYEANCLMLKLNKCNIGQWSTMAV